MNYSDSERVAKILDKLGFVEAYIPEEADLVIVNTCSVRQTAENKAFGFMSNLKKQHPNIILGVTGCMVRQTGDRKSSKDKLFQHKILNFVFRIEDMAKLAKILEQQFPEHDLKKLPAHFGDGSLENYFKIAPKVQNNVQVFVPIMQGCDKFCTYCIVPYTRGREKSRKILEIYEECKNLVKNGAKEITLLGQNVNSYTDGESARGKRCFAKLLLKIDKLHELGLSRLRFTAPHPQDFTDDVITALAEMKTSCPYIHLPSQHGSNTTLRAMGRNYSVEKYEEIIKKLREKMPNLNLATDIIVGFPGETDEQFQELCDFAQRVNFGFSYTAIFSPRKNTPAARMEKDFIPNSVKKERFHKFDEIIKKQAFAMRQKYVGKTLQILVEKSEPTTNGLYKNSGRSREFLEVWFESGRSFIGKEIEIEIEAAQNYVLAGKPVVGLKVVG